jgi:NADPH2:quinone reductase
VTLAGGQVIGTVGSPAKARHAQAAGMKEAIFYKTESIADRVKALTAGRGVPVIIDMDFASTGKLLAEGVLAPHGRVICFGSNAPDITLNFRALLFPSLSLKFFLVYDLTPADRQTAQARLNELLQTQQLQHAISRRFALADIVAAHEAVEAGQDIGNVVVDLI